MPRIPGKSVLIQGNGFTIEIDRFDDGDTMIEYDRDDRHPENCIIVLSQAERRALRAALGE